MMPRQRLWLSTLISCLLFAATAPAVADQEIEPRLLDHSESCGSMIAAPDRIVEPSSQPPCRSLDTAMDVIRIPPVVILGDRLEPPTYHANTHDPEFRKYLKRVRKAIDHEKDYPFTAQQMRWEGSSLIKFTISPQGELLQTRIDRTSGFLILDEAAEMAVIKAFPVVPPKHLFTQPIEFKIPVMFELH